MSLRILRRGPRRHVEIFVVPALATLAMAGVVVSLDAAFTDGASWPALFCKVILGGASYACVLLPLSKARLAILKSALRTP